MLAGITNFFFGENSTEEINSIDRSTAERIDEVNKENIVDQEQQQQVSFEDEGWIIVDIENPEIEINSGNINNNNNTSSAIENERTNYVPNFCNYSLPECQKTTNNKCSNDNTLTAIYDTHNITNITNNNNNKKINTKVNNNKSVTTTTTTTCSNGTMDESWFVTPPPCFTHPNTFAMESSPLEDILIEHPSISVFCPRVISKGHSSHYAYNHQKQQQKKKQQNNNNNNSSSNTSTTVATGGAMAKQATSNRAKKQAQMLAKQEAEKSRAANIAVDLSLKTVGLLSEIGNLVTSKQKANESQKYLKKTFMDRQNKVACRQNGRPSRQKKLSATINGYSVNRKMC